MILRTLLMVLLLLVAGCGRDLPDMVVVQGTVTFDGGPCPGPGKIFFGPIEAAQGYSLRPAVAFFDTDGAYQVESFRDAAGLVPGRYEVAIQCWEVEPGEDGVPGKSFVPGDYQPGELDVDPTATEAIVANFDVPLKK